LRELIQLTDQGNVVVDRLSGKRPSPYTLRDTPTEGTVELDGRSLVGNQKPWRNLRMIGGGIAS
jgi:hypothetical protein